MRKTTKHAKKMLLEKYVTSESDPSTLLWCNGTTDMRFDIGSNKWKDINNSSDAAVTSPLSPIYLTSNIKYALDCLKSHITKDFKVQTASKKKHADALSSHGILVLVKLKAGLKLFDFTDVADFQQVFNQHADGISKLFKEAEPYFAFNTGIANDAQKDVPIEFSIVQKLLIWMTSSINKTKIDKETGEEQPILDFFTRKSFTSYFKNIDKDGLEKLESQLPITPEKYKDFIKYYDSILAKGKKDISKTGRDQVWLHGNLLKILPPDLTSEQCEKVNSYMHLLIWCLDVRDILQSLDEKDTLLKKELDEILNTSQASKRKKYVDILQACLYIGLQLENFNGFYCPEYIASKSRNTGDAPSIALFNDDCIEKVSNCSMQEIDEAVQYAKAHPQNGASDCLAAVHALRDSVLGLRKQKEEEQTVRDQRQALIDSKKYYLADSSYEKAAVMHLDKISDRNENEIAYEYYREIKQEVEKRIAATAKIEDPVHKGLISMPPEKLVLKVIDDAADRVYAMKQKARDQIARQRDAAERDYINSRARFYRRY